MNTALRCHYIARSDATMHDDCSNHVSVKHDPLGRDVADRVLSQVIPSAVHCSVALTVSPGEIERNFRKSHHCSLVLNMQCVMTVVKLTAGIESMIRPKGSLDSCD